MTNFNKRRSSPDRYPRNSPSNSPKSERGQRAVAFVAIQRSDRVTPIVGAEYLECPRFHQDKKVYLKNKRKQFIKYEGRTKNWKLESVFETMVVLSCD